MKANCNAPDCAEAAVNTESELVSNGNEKQHAMLVYIHASLDIMSANSHTAINQPTAMHTGISQYKAYNNSSPLQKPHRQLAQVR